MDACFGVCMQIERVLFAEQGFQRTAPNPEIAVGMDGKPRAVGLMGVVRLLCFAYCGMNFFAKVVFNCELRIANYELRITGRSDKPFTALLICIAYGEFL